MRKICLLILTLVLAACINTPRQYKSAGFESLDEVTPYLKHYLYYANKITDDEWKAFYQRFPEYWKDMQSARELGSSIQFHPYYTAYAFRWCTMQDKEKEWSAADIDRLDRGELLKQDDVFKVVYAAGPPKRIIWDNEFEILVYESDRALIFENGVYGYGKECEDCWDEYKMNTNEGGLTGPDVLYKLELSRPSY